MAQRHCLSPPTHPQRMRGRTPETVSIKPPTHNECGDAHPMTDYRPLNPRQPMYSCTKHVCMPTCVCAPNMCVCKATCVESVCMQTNMCGVYANQHVWCVCKPTCVVSNMCVIKLTCVESAPDSTVTNQHLWYMYVPHMYANQHVWNLHQITVHMCVYRHTGAKLVVEVEFFWQGTFKRNQ
jgi:hypothetical protein